MNTSPEWHYAGSAEVNTSTNRIVIPDPVFEAAILPRGGDAYWAYERVVGFLVVSNAALEKKPEYKPQGSSRIGNEEDRFRATIPKQFFADFDGKGNPVPEKARVEYGEQRHFVYRSAMATGDTRSCYLLTRHQLEETIATPDDWAESLDSIPRFMRE